MKKEYLPFYNSLNDKEKQFWMECTKEELIDHLIGSINNGEVLLSRIEEAIKYIEENCIIEDGTVLSVIIAILKGSDK